MAMKGISRRSFVSCAAAVGAMGAMAGVAAADETTETQWDLEADVVVVGSGTAVVSAIACDTMGAGKIIVLEKSPDLFGGTSVLSGGGQALGIHDWYAEEGVEDTREAQLTYLHAVGEGRLDAAPQEAFVDNSNEYCHWVVDTFGWSGWKLAHCAFGDYYGYYEGANPDIVGRGSWVPKDVEGNSVGASGQWEAYRAYIDSRDTMELMMGVAGKRLVTDASGAVIGIIAEGEDGEIAIKANKAVVLGTGGFEHDPDMRRWHMPFPIQRSCGVSTNTGDAQKMSARIGAQLVYMDGVFGLPFFYTKPEWSMDDFAFDGAGTDWYGARAMPHSIIVNHKGRRFGDEAGMYDTFLRAFGTYDTGSEEFVNIPGYWICDSQYTEKYLLPGYTTTEELPEWIFKADTLEELADMMGIDADGLLDEVAAFNEHAANNEDPAWDRNKPNAQMSLAMMGPSMSLTGEAPTSSIGTVEQGPFYCVRYVPGTCSTNGGMRIDGNAQVLDVDGNPIPGLYGIGACACTVTDYWTGGATIGQGSVMSYVAARHICGA